LSIQIKDVDGIAKLAKLSFEEEEKQTFTDQFNQILQFVEKLNELDTQDIPPTYHVLEVKNIMRADEVKESLDREKVLQNAPKRKTDFFSVPKVIG
jgi:aspartyl-tRNA(Asn)/glutamyl-tRNA(Gln) amidotransferase subunit C